MSLNTNKIVTKMAIRKLAFLVAVISAVAAVALGLVGHWSTGNSLAAEGADSSHDLKLKTFLQKRFRIPNADAITLGAPDASPFTGLFSRSVSVTDDKGGSTSLTLFTDAAGEKLVLGQVLDLSKDPWGRLDMGVAHLDDQPTMGPADAPITMVEFADYECPHCARALPHMETAVRNTYKGRLRLLYKYFPLPGHTWARAAAVAAECARVQNPDAFWDFTAAFYRDQATIDIGNIQAHVDALAADSKLDGSVLHACMLGKSADERIDQDLQDGTALHVTSTPTFFINGIPVAGDPDPKTLDFIIGSELERLHAAH
jgi:protein-disulfide isomerase